jgi:HK97 family phage portal protein
MPRERGGFPTQIELYHPDHVRGQIQEGAPVWYLDGKKIDNPFHRRAYPIPGVVLGLSQVAHHARSIGLDLTLTQFGLQFFQDGAMPGAVLTNEDEEIEQDDAKKIKSKWMATNRGSREPAVLGKGWKYQPIQINPEEGQFLATHQYTAADCARMFGPGFVEILGYENSTKGGSLTYANLQSREAHLLVFSLSKWIRRVDRLLGAMIPNTQFIRLNRKALLETTTIERFQAYALALGGQAFMNVDEVRRVEDLDPNVKVIQPSSLKPPKPDAGAGADQGGSA